MRALDRKLVRDLAAMRGQVLTIALVVACGIAVFVAAMGAYHSLLGAQADYYRATRFADVFVSLKRAPLSLEQQLAELPGIGQLETRLVKDVTIDLSGITVPISGRIIALPEWGDARLNRLYLRQGRLPEPNAQHEVVVSEAFANANALRSRQLVVGDPERQIARAAHRRRRLVSRICLCHQIGRSAP